MEVVRLSDPTEFLRRTGSLLEQSEARHNLLYGILGTIVEVPGVYEDFVLWVVEDAGRPVAAAVQTLPHPPVIADAATESAANALARAMAPMAGAVAGLRANVPTDRWFIDAWVSRTGDTAELEMAQGVFELTEVVPQPAPPGAIRPGRADDLDLLVDWFVAFVIEAIPAETIDRDQFAANVQRRIDGERGSGVWIWERDGQPVSFSAHGNPTPNGMRVGPVYTPPGHRGNGYASAVVAHQSAALLAAGRRFCFLYTDLANPTSNAIYERIGYRRIGDAAAWRFVKAE